VSTTATLVIAPRPDLAAGARYFEVDCEHARTTAVVLADAAAPVLLDDDVVRTLLVRHAAEERCGCTRRLWKRYGPEGVPQ
jgi:predicted DsbA family dithiol-disulfide isomerase